MYAAAGGASLASRQARRNVKKQHSSSDVVHQQFQRRFNQLQAQHAPASADHYNARQHEQLLGRLPDNCRHWELKEPFPLHSRLPSYVDLNGRITGFGSCDMSEGKAATAWSERERRTSASEATNLRVKQKEAHGRWMKRNRRKGLKATPDMRKVKLLFPRRVTRVRVRRRIVVHTRHSQPHPDIHDSSFGGSSSEDDDVPGGLYGHQSAAANALLYVGLGTVAIGLVIAFVGTGEKGFKTLELRLIGPTLIGSGVLCCLVRIFLCVCPTRCMRRRFRHRHRRKHQTPGAPLGRHGFPSDKSTDYYRHLPYSRAAQDFMLEQPPKKNKKRVSIIPAGQSDKIVSPPRQIPQINVPRFVSSPDKDNLIELNRLGTSLEDTHSLSSEDSFNENMLLETGSVERLARLKSTLTFDEPDTHGRTTVPRIDEEDSEALDEESAPTSPMLATLTPHVVPTHELVLSPAKLQNGD